MIGIIIAHMIMISQIATMIVSVGYPGFARVGSAMKFVAAIVISVLMRTTVVTIADGCRNYKSYCEMPLPSCKSAG